MTKQELETKMEKMEAIEIPVENCYWDKEKRLIKVKTEEWSGIIPQTELEGQLVNSKLPIGVKKFFENSKMMIIGKENENFIFSKRRYLRDKKEKIKEGEVKTARVTAVESWGCYCTIDEDITIVVSAVNYSRTRFYDLKKVVRIGEEFPVKIIEKVEKNGEIFLYGSRKIDEKRKFKEGDIIQVKLGNLTKKGDGIFCEVTPTVAGILDISPTWKYRIGRKVFVKIVRIKDKGFKLSFT